jgi:DNA ligase-1
MTTLYSRDKSGKDRYWSVSVNKKQDGSVFLTRRYGQVGGKETETSTEIKVGKNIGKSNETSPFQQAELEAASLRKKQMDAGFKENIEETESTVILPMLANKWEDRAKYISEPFFVQPKLDGVRMLVGVKEGSFFMMSRTGKIVSMPHIEAELKPLLKEGQFLDGENYTTELSFEEITGMCRRVLESPPGLSKIKFHVFDYFDFSNLNQPFVDRLQELESRFGNLEHTVLVPTETLTKSTQVRKKHDDYAAMGYEGIMIRDRKGLYKLAERSNHLLKFKAFQTEEYKIVGAEEGKGKDKGTVIWICSITSGDDSGTFSVRPKGTFSERTEWFKNYKSYVGKNLTVQFQNLTNGGIPRFPVGIAIRDYE